MIARPSSVSRLARTALQSVLFRAVAVALACHTAIAPLRSGELDYGETYAVVVGVLHWQNDSWSSFSDANRQDQLLYDTLIENGMPEENGALLLDDQATLKQIESELQRVAASAPVESTLIFYYAGHGTCVTPDKFCFANYDMSGPESGLDVDRIGEILTRSFRGRRVLLFADCCHSGSLRRVVDALAETGIEAACVTSVVSNRLSTGNWTFTQTLLEGLRGDACVDFDGDGEIELSELDRAVSEAMAFRESQKSGFSSERLSGEFVLRATSAAFEDAGESERHAIGGHVTAPRDERPAVGKIVGRDGEELLVRFYSYSSYEDLPVPLDEVEPIEPMRFELGAEVIPLGRSSGTTATVARHDGPFHWIVFPEWTEEPGRWVIGRHIRRADDSSTADAMVADAIVEWQGRWYPAAILESDGERTLIHYIGYDSSWDEWVPPERIRRKPAEAAEE